MKKLDKRKELASKVLKVGKNKIKFDSDKLAEIKEAITKQDIKELYSEGYITIKPKRGRKTIKKRKTRKGPGKRKRTVSTKKQDHVKIVRKLRNYIKELKKHETIDNVFYQELRKKIRAKTFKTKAHLKEYIEGALKQ